METKQNGQIVRKPASSPTSQAIAPRATGDGTLVGFLESLKGELARALPKHLTVDRLARVSITALRTTPHLAECTKESFAASIFVLGALGLEPNTPLGEAYLIPRRNTRNGGRYECSVIIGFQGMMSLARRSGQVSIQPPVPVFQGDKFEYSLGLTPKLEHVPSDAPDREDPKRLTHVYTIAQVTGSPNPIIVVMSRGQIETRRKRGASGSGARTPWDTDYIAMAQKTVIRELFKWAPRSAEMARAVVADESHEMGRAPFAALPDEHATALLTAGIAEPEYAAEPEQEYVTADGEVIDEPRMREPGED